MLETYQRGETAVLRMEVRNNAGELYTPDTSIEAAVWDSAGAAFLAASDMTAESTGVYYYDLATLADSALGCYRVQFATVHAGRTSKAEDFFFLEDRGQGHTGWSVMSLADQMRAEMDANADAAGGTIPDRIAKIIREKGKWLFDHKDWLFRKTPGTLAIIAGATEIAMPADFKELDSTMMRVSDANNYRLVWTEDPSAWQAAKDMIGNTATGTPRVALLYYTAGAWKAKIWPAADQAYSYDYWYIKASPWSGATPIADNITVSPTYWPEDFDEGWYALCAYQIYGRFRANDGWQGFKSEFKDWLKLHEIENNETIGSGLEPISDVMQDFRSTGAGIAGWLPGGSFKWFGST